MSTASHDPQNLLPSATRDVVVRRLVEEELHFAEQFDQISDRKLLSELLPWRVARQMTGLSLLEARLFVNRRLMLNVSAAPFKAERISLSEAFPHVFLNVDRMWHLNSVEFGVHRGPVQIKNSPNVLMPKAAREFFPAAAKDSSFITLYPAPRGQHPCNIVIDLAKVTAPKCLIGDEIRNDRRLVVLGEVPSSAIRWVGPDLRHGQWADRRFDNDAFDDSHTWTLSANDSDPAPSEPSAQPTIERERA